jgi:type IV pilus assembly protein PilC
MIKETDLKLKVREMLMGPLIMVGVMTGVGVIILTAAVPKLSLLLEKLELAPPLTTKITIGLSRFFVQEWFGIFLFLAGLFLLFKIVLKIDKTRKFLDKFFLRSPLTNQIVRKINTAYTVKKLSFLIASGVSLTGSLENIAGTIGNSYYKNALMAASEKIKNGCKVSEALRSCQDLYPAMFVQMIEVGEETGQLPRILEKLSDFLDDEISRDIKGLAVFTELVLMVVFGLLAGFFAVSAIQPLIPFVF